MKQKVCKAFTIVELVVVIAVIAILAAVLVPTFSTVVKKAKVSADEQTVANMNTALSVYAAEGGIKGAEDLYKAFSEFLGDGGKTVQPQSAEYGYHFWYNTNSNKVELALSSALNTGSLRMVSIQSTVAANGIDSSIAYGVRGLIREGYVLLDNAGSGLADAVTAFEGMTGASDYVSALQDLKSMTSHEYDSDAAQDLASAMERTAIVTDHGVFRGENATQIVFEPGVQTLTGVVFEYKDGEVTEYSLGGDEVVADVSGEIFLPQSVTRVEFNALYFGEPSDVIVNVPSGMDIASVFDAGSADVQISCGGDIYTIEGHELICNGAAVEGIQLDYSAHVTAFEIGVQGVETVGGVYSVALDALDGEICLYACNFVSDSDGYDSRVTWSLDKAPMGTKISEDGVLTGITAGEILIQAAAVSDASVRASFTVRVGEISSVEVSLEKDGAAEIVAFDESDTFTKMEMTGGEQKEYTFHVKPVVNFADVDCSSGYTLKVLEGDAEFDGDTLCLPAEGTVKAELSFVNYPSVVRYFEFHCAAKVFDYDENAEFYRFGTVNPVPICYAEGTDLSLLTIEAEAFADQSNNASALVSDDKTEISFSGGGKILIKAVADGTVADQFVVEVISGAVNVSDETQFVSNKSMCLTGDIVRSKGMIFVGIGCYLYGNGYTVTAKESSYSFQNGYFVYLAGTLDNVSIVGVAVDNHYTSASAFFQTAATVYVNMSGAGIYNSYIKNGRYAVQLKGMTGQMTIKNTIIEGGAFSLGITGTSGKFDLYLEDIQIVQPRSADFVGTGFAFNEGGEEKVTLHFSGQNNSLQDFVSKSDIEKLSSDYQAALETLWDKSELSEYKYSDGEETYLHLGIFALLKGAMPTIVMEEDCNLYGMMSELELSDMKIRGIFYAFDRDKAGTSEYVNAHLADWLNNVPNKTFAYESVPTA